MPARLHLLALFAACAASAATSAPETPVVAEPALTPAEIARSKELEELSREGKALLESFAAADRTGATPEPAADRERRVSAIFAHYERLLRENPDHLETLLLYGKFLRAAGERELAFKVFLRADRVSPALAAVKHQLGAHLAEEGEHAAALPLLRRATELAPDEPRYRYDLAEFLSAADSLHAPGGPLSRAERDRLMLDNFAAAARLRPAEAGFRWRHAEAFGEVATPDASAALAAWDALAREAGTDTEKEVVGLHRARWLTALGRTDEARSLVKASRMPALDATRRRLLDDIVLKDAALRDKSPARH